MPSKLYSIDRTYDMHKLFYLIEHTKAGLDLIFMFKNDSSIYLNSSNLQILKALAKKAGRVIKFEVENNNHLDYIDAVNNDNLTFSPTSIDLSDTEAMQVEKSKKQFFKVPQLGFSIKKKRKSVSDSVYAEVEKDVGKFKLKFIFVILTFFVILGLAGVGFWALIYYLPRATVKITLDSETLINLVDVKAKTDVKQVDAAGGIIPATSLDVEESESGSADTTGEKEIGEYAKGTVTIYNKKSKSVKIKKGATIKLKKDGKDPLAYVTVNDVEIPALETKDVIVPGNTENGSTAPETTTKAEVLGTKDVEIKAAQFGKDYNLGKDQKFEVAGLKYDSEGYAQNASEIKGGTSDKVKVVTESDLRTLKKTLDDSLKVKAADDLKKKVVTGQNLQESSITITPVKEDYSNKADDVADKLSLNLTVKATGIAYSDTDLKSAISELVKKVVPESFKLSESGDYDYEVAVLKNASDPNTINLQVKLKSYVTPKIDEDKIKNDLVGLKVEDARDYLSKVKNVKEYKLELRPKLPSFLVAMPRKPENISVEIVR